MFAEACVLICKQCLGCPLKCRGDVSCIFSGSSATPQKAKPGSARSFRNPARSPSIVTFREPHPGQNVRQRMLHEYLRKLLLSPDEFMRLLKDC